MEQFVKSNPPLISIVTPTFNSSRFISQTIQSVLAQSYRHWEMLIVDDCSRDDTCKIVEEFARQDDRIHLTRLPRNSGAAVARYIAIKSATGHYLAFLDSDDLWLPQKLEQQLEFMQRNNVTFSYTSYRFMSEEGDRCSEIVNPPSSFNYHGLLKQTGIYCLTVMIAREQVNEVELINVQTRNDFVLWLQLLKKGIVARCLQRDLARYRLVNKSLSANKMKGILSIWHVYRNIEKLGLLYSSWYFMNYAWHAYRKRRKFKIS